MMLVVPTVRVVATLVMLAWQDTTWSSTSFDGIGDSAEIFPPRELAQSSCAEPSKEPHCARDARVREVISGSGGARSPARVPISCSDSIRLGFPPADPAEIPSVRLRTTSANGGPSTPSAPAFRAVPEAEGSAATNRWPPEKREAAIDSLAELLAWYARREGNAAAPESVPNTPLKPHGVSTRRR